MGCLNYKLYPQNLHALLAGAQHKTPPPFSCAEQMKASTGVSEGLELQWKPRRWSEHWFACFGDCTGAGWQGCCLAYWLPCVAFGCNTHKVLRKSFWLEALTYMLILGLAGIAYHATRLAEFTTCDIPGTAAEEAAQTEEALVQAMRARLDCKMPFLGAEMLILAATLLCLVVWAVFVGGPRRRQMREAMGIPVTDPRGACCTSCHNEGQHCNSDCCLHYWCTCCALAQETRTVLEVEREQREEMQATPAGYMPLIAAPGKHAAMERAVAGEKLLPV